MKVYCKNCTFDWLDKSDNCEYEETNQYTDVRKSMHECRRKSIHNPDGECKDYRKKPWKFWIK